MNMVRQSDKFVVSYEKRRTRALPELAGHVLASLVERKRWGNRLEDGRVFAAFAQAAGEKIAAHAKGTRLQRGELTVTVDSAGWRQQLAFLSDTLVQNTNARLGRPIVRSLRLIHGTAPPPGSFLPDRPSAPPLPPARSEDLAAADRLSHLLEDAELASLLARCYVNAHRAHSGT
jgi:hypothetical protein